jgi:two-component system LytT family response regulator
MLNAIIVDDEVIGAKGLVRLLTRYCPGVHVLATVHSIDEAEQKISSLAPDIVFLDIEMPFGSGFDLLNRISSKNIPGKNIGFEVIFTTSYSQYAIKAFRHTAIDYLLKPIDSDELVDAVKKCEEKKERGTVDLKKIESLFSSLSQTNKILKLPVHTQEGIIYLDTEKVVRLEADGNYTKIHLVGGQKFTSSRTLKEYEEMMPHKEFFRIHKANLVNLSHVKQYIKGKGGEVLMSDGSLLEVSRYKKADFLTLLAP